jgi:hypothetical protein
MRNTQELALIADTENLVDYDLVATKPGSDKRMSAARFMKELKRKNVRQFKQISTNQDILYATFVSLFSDGVESLNGIYIAAVNLNVTPTDYLAGVQMNCSVNDVATSLNVKNCSFIVATYADNVLIDIKNVSFPNMLVNMKTIFEKQEIINEALIALNPENLISSDANNQIVPGSDGKLMVHPSTNVGGGSETPNVLVDAESEGFKWIQYPNDPLKKKLQIKIIKPNLTADLKLQNGQWSDHSDLKFDEVDDTLYVPKIKVNKQFILAADGSVLNTDSPINIEIGNIEKTIDGEVYIRKMDVYFKTKKIISQDQGNQIVEDANGRLYVALPSTTPDDGSTTYVPVAVDSIENGLQIIQGQLFAPKEITYALARNATQGVSGIYRGFKQGASITTINSGGKAHRIAQTDSPRSMRIFVTPDAFNGQDLIIEFLASAITITDDVQSSLVWPDVTPYAVSSFNTPTANSPKVKIPDSMMPLEMYLGSLASGGLSQYGQGTGYMTYRFVNAAQFLNMELMFTF